MEEAARRNMNPRLLVEFVDGSKTAVEMCAIGNATGLIPDCDGMHGPAAGPKELAKTLIPKKDGGLLDGIGRVDYTIGKGVSPGVFVLIAVAKRDLKPGEVLDQIGEYTYRAWAMETQRARAARALPAGLLTGAKTTAAIAKGELITAHNTTLPNAAIVDLRRRQDEMLYGKDPANV